MARKTMMYHHRCHNKCYVVATLILSLFVGVKIWNSYYGDPAVSSSAHSTTIQLTGTIKHKQQQQQQHQQQQQSKELMGSSANAAAGAAKDQAEEEEHIRPPVIAGSATGTAIQGAPAGDYDDAITAMTTMMIRAGGGSGRGGDGGSGSGRSRRWWTRWPYDAAPFPCFHPTDRNANASLTWKDPAVLRSPPGRDGAGLIFVKLVKVASTSAVGVHLRLATNAAKRRKRQQHQQQQQRRRLPSKREGEDFDHRDEEESSSPPSEEDSSSSPFDICKVRFVHGLASAPVKRYGQRNKMQSFMWSMVREPTARAVSQFYYDVVSRRGVRGSGGDNNNYDARLIQYLRSNPRIRGHHALSWLSTSPYRRGTGGKKNNGTRGSNNNAAADAVTAAVVRTAGGIFRDYNFIGVAERFDESMVVLKMLLNVPLADVLYFRTKVGGGYDGGRSGRCIRITPAPKAGPSPAVRKYLNSSAWRNFIAPELAFYRAVVDRLDATIDAVLGREEFDRQFALYRRAQTLASQRCNFTTVRLPCSATNPLVPLLETDCLWYDAGCGMKCLDEVADQLGLWDV